MSFYLDDNEAQSRSSTSQHHFNVQLFSDAYWVSLVRNSPNLEGNPGNEQRLWTTVIFWVQNWFACPPPCQGQPKSAMKSFQTFSKTVTSMASESNLKVPCKTSRPSVRPRTQWPRVRGDQHHIAHYMYYMTYNLKCFKVGLKSRPQIASDATLNNLLQFYDDKIPIDLNVQDGCISKVMVYWILLYAKVLTLLFKIRMEGLHLIELIPGILCEPNQCIDLNKCSVLSLNLLESCFNRHSSAMVLPCRFMQIKGYDFKK